VSFEAACGIKERTSHSLTQGRTHFFFALATNFLPGLQCLKYTTRRWESIIAFEISVFLINTISDVGLFFDKWTAQLSLWARQQKMVD